MATQINEQFETLNAFPAMQRPPANIPVAGPSGASAYQIAVAHGFEGTEAEWLVSQRPTDQEMALQVASYMREHPAEAGPQGEPGDRGPEGERGAEGAAGERGIEGQPGATGARGPVGPTGERGATGEPGPAGERGERGDTGPRGEQGFRGVQGEPGPQGQKGDEGTPGATGARGEAGQKGATGSTGAAGPSPKVQMPDVTLTQTALVAISAGIRSVSAACAGALLGDTLTIHPKAALPAGYAIHNAVCTAPGTIAVTLTAPLLAIGANYSIPCAVVALR